MASIWLKALREVDKISSKTLVEAEEPAKFCTAFESLAAEQAFDEVCLALLLRILLDFIIIVF